MNDGRVVFEIGRVEAYGGRLAGQFVVNGRSGLSVGGDLILTQVQLAPLLSEFAGYDRLEGTGSASLQFLGVGNDVGTIMSGLEGQGDFAFGAGAITGFDLAGMIPQLRHLVQGGRARAPSMTASAPISPSTTVSCETTTWCSMRHGAGSKGRDASIWARGASTTASFRP